MENSGLRGGLLTLTQVDLLRLGVTIGEAMDFMEGKAVFLCSKTPVPGDLLPSRNPAAELDTLVEVNDIFDIDEKKFSAPS